MEKIFDKLKYNPSTIFVVNSLDNYNFNNIIKKAKENNLVEYNNEYVSFNSAIVIYTLKENNIGFINSASDDWISYANFIMNLFNIIHYIFYGFFTINQIIV